MVSGIYAGILALMMLGLAWPITVQRKSKKIGLGDAGDHALQRVIRVHANFVEYVPIALIMLLLLELQNTPQVILHIFGVALIISRFAHARGLGASAGYSAGRFYGTLGTWLVIIGLAFSLIWMGVLS